MIECKVVTIASKLVRIFYKSDHLMQQTKLFQQRLEMCSNGLPNHLIHGDPSIIQKINNQSKNIHTIMGHPQITINLLL
jgi:hypothetical protein